MSGLEFLQAVKRANAALPVVVMTAFGTVESAVEAMKAGASDYVTEAVFARRTGAGDSQGARHRAACARKTARCARRWDAATPTRISWRRATRCRQCWRMVERVAPTNSTVLLGGESGVGKDLIARAIHEHSQRASGPVHQDQQHGHSGESAGKRTVRLREGRVFRRDGTASRENSSWPTRARFFSTKSATCRRRFR